MGRGPVATGEAASILARGGNLRVITPLSTRFGAVLPPIALSLVGLRAIDGGPGRTWPLLVVLLAAAVLAFVIHSRAFVTVTGGVLRWRTGFRTHEVSLLDVDRPLRAGGWNDRLIVPMAGRRPLTLWVRVWSGAALDSVQERLLYNVRVGRPRAQRASSGEQR